MKIPLKVGKCSSYRQMLGLVSLWASLTLNIYLFLLQPVHIVSRGRLGLSALLAGMLILLLFIWQGRENSLPLRLSKGWAVLFALWGTLLVYFAKPQPSMALFALPETLEVTFTPWEKDATTVQIFWMHNGVADISFQKIDWTDEAQLQPDGVHLFVTKDQPGGFRWNGKGWQSFTLTLKSDTPLKVHLRTRHTDYEDVIEPSTNAEYTLQIPIGSHRLDTTFLALIWGNVFLSFFLLFLVSVAFPRQGNLFALSPRWQDLLPWFALALFALLGWAAGMVIARYNRLYADDYCYLNILREKGWLGANMHAYLHITGRFAGHFLDFIAYHLGENIAPLGLYVLMIAGGGSLYLLMRTLYPDAKAWHTASLAGALPLFALITTANPVQSVFWTLHALSICAGLGFLLLVFRTVFQYLNTPPDLKNRLGLFLLALFTGGFHETLSIFGILFLSLLAWLEWDSQRHKIKPKAFPVSATAVLGLLTGFLIVIVAPGNTSRMVEIGFSSTPKEILMQTGELILSSFHWMLGGPYQNGFTLLVLLVVFLLGLQWGVHHVIPSYGFRPLHPLEKMAFFFLPYLSILLMLLPSAILKGYFPLRSLFIPQMVLTLGVFGHGFWAGTWLKRQNIQVLATVAIVVTALILYTGWLIYPAVSHFYQDMQRHASEWDARVALITKARQEGQSQVFVPPYRFIAEVDLQPDPENWLNQCIQTYYGIAVRLQPSGLP